jgi:dihydrofolate reductase
MTTQYYTASSLDGFIATLDDSLDWLFPLGDINETGYPSFIKEVGALAMGSATYEWMLRHVIRPDGREPVAWPYAQPTWVFSRRRLPPVEGADIRFVSGDVRPVHADMKKSARGRNVWLVGGGELVGQFYDAGLARRTDRAGWFGHPRIRQAAPAAQDHVAFPHPGVGTRDRARLR